MNPLWKPQPPAKVGDSLNDVRTPALLVDLDVLESNMRKMSKIMESYPNVAVRPHVKAHKAPAIGKMQMENGCVGLCSQTLTETQAMVYGGGGMDILLSNQCIGKHKLRELVALVSAGADIALCVDDADNARDASEVAAEAGVNLKLVVEVNVGQERCGVEPGQPAADLAKIVMNLPNVTFKGIQCYNGWNQHIRSRSDCQAAVDKVVELTKLTLKALSEAGIACDYVTGGGTGTFRFEAGSGVFTEVQPGSYIFMDVDYWRNESASGGRFEDFGHSLLVLTTVQSVCPPRRAVCDAGMKATSLDSGPPLVRGRGDLTYSNGGDEHGILNPAGGLTVGDRLFLIPGHCDPTVNLYDWIVAMRGERVEAVWPVLGRGPGV